MNFNKLYLWENPDNKRYYAAQIRQDLFNDWIINIWHGTNGTKLGRYRYYYCPDQQNAIQFLEKIQKQRLKRGYHFKESLSLN